MSEEQSRRQSRGKKPQSYRLNDEYSFLDEEGSAPSGTQTPPLRDEEQSDGDDFMPDAQEEPDDDLDEDIVDDEEDDEEGEEEEEEEISDYEVRGPKKVAHRDISVIEVEVSHGPSNPLNKHRRKPLVGAGSPKNTAHGRGVKPTPVDGDKLRTRGVADFSKIGGQEIRLKDLFGPDIEALKPFLATRDYWCRQEALPTRESDGLRRSFFETPDAREKGSKTLHQWYADTGHEAFASAQRSRWLSTEEGQLYIENFGPPSLNVLLGAAISPQIHLMKKGTYISIAKPFGDDQNRKGWLFNLGARIQEAQWSTNESGSTQYLAVIVEQDCTTGRQPKPMQNPKAPAFTATRPYPASIQIWAFEATSDGELDASQKPRLDLVLCTDWGSPKQLRWCPVESNSQCEQPTQEAASRIGLLAGIWSDGRVRVLDIVRPQLDEESQETVYMHYTQAAFDVALPNTVPTCLHWLSGVSLAVATAAGTVAIWTLNRPGTFTADGATPQGPRPWFYQQLADTYILTMSSGWPSQPQFLSISIADGFARLYDLRNPNTDTVPSIRGRTLCISQAWHEQTQTFVMPDEHYIVKHTPIRRYHHNLYSMRLESSVTRVATSPIHPGMLVGTAEGNVEASNPVGRIANYKTLPWQQRWFAHEWRGPVENLLAKPSESDDVDMLEGGSIESSASAANDTSIVATKVSPSILSQPLARITEGFKAIQPGIQHSSTSKKPNNPETNKGITIFEEQSAITALAWNPNLKYGTWAVAGMGNGLLRVEDIGV